MEELLQVPGMGRELLYGRPRRQRDGRTVFQRGLMDFLTVYTATGRVNVNYAAPEVLAALPGMGWEEARSLVAARARQLLEASDLSSRAPAEALPFLTTQPSDTFSLVATAWLEGSATRRSLKVVARRDAASPAGTPAAGLVRPVLALAPGPQLFRPLPLPPRPPLLLRPRRPRDFEPACERRPMDLLSPGAILKQLSLGVSFGPDALHLSLLSSHWERVRRVDAETIDGFQAMPPDRRRRRVQAFLERNRAAHCSVVVSLPRREVLLRQLELPLEARENLAKVVEYQRVHLLPSEEQAVATDTLAVREDSDPPRLRVTLFVVLQSTLDRTLDSCRQLGLSPDRILPGAVALADYLRASLPKAAAAPSLAVQLDPPRGELAGLVQGQLRLCKEFRYDSSNLEEVLESEAELFRGEAGLDEEAPLQLYLAGHGGPLSQSEGRLPFRALPPPAPSGPAHALAPPAAADWPALAAAFLRLQAQGGPGGQPAACRPAAPQIALGMGPHLRPGRPQRPAAAGAAAAGTGAAAGLVPADEPGAGAPGAGGERLQKAGGRTGPLAGAGRPAGSPPEPQPTPLGRPGRAVTRPARRRGGDAADPAGGAAPHPGDLRPGRGPAQDPGGLPPFRAGGAGLLHQPELQGTGDLPPPGPTGGAGRPGGAFRCLPPARPIPPGR